LRALFPFDNIGALRFRDLRRQLAGLALGADEFLASVAVTRQSVA
jgi:hypothetical protein